MKKLSSGATTKLIGDAPASEPERKFLFLVAMAMFASRYAKSKSVRNPLTELTAFNPKGVLQNTGSLISSTPTLLSASLNTSVQTASSSEPSVTNGDAT